MSEQTVAGKEPPQLPNCVRPPLAGTDDGDAAAYARGQADFWQLFKTLFYDTTSDPTMTELRRYKFARMGAPEEACGETMPRCLLGIECTLSRHLHPAGLRGLNKPQSRAVWDIRDGLPELFMMLLTDLGATRAG